MRWLEFKQRVELAGIGDDDEIASIDVWLDQWSDKTDRLRFERLIDGWIIENG